MKVIRHIVPQIRPIVKKVDDVNAWDAIGNFWKAMKKSNISYENPQNNQDDSIEIIQFEKAVPPTIPPFTPIGRFEFDEKIYEATPEEVENAPFEFPESRSNIVGRNTPICRDFTQLKGANNDFFCMAISRGLTRKPAMFKSKWFVFHYYHSDSFLGNIVKSRPGVLVSCHNTNIFNTQLQIKGEIPKSIRKSAFPFKSSVYRTNLKKFLRKSFLDLYLKDESFAKKYNGLYEFSINLYPENEEEKKEFIEHLALCLKDVAKKTKPMSERDIQWELSRLPWYDVQRVLKRNNVQDFEFKDYKPHNRPKRPRKTK